MKKKFTLGLMLLATVACAQSPTNLGTDAADGITYSTYNLIDHGTVSSIRIMAQNTTVDDSTKWEFFTGNYNDNWRPYTAQQVALGFDQILDPTTEPASARYNTAFGGATGRLPYVQAGLYYTFVVENVVATDAKMSILETDFSPVSIDTVYNTPTAPNPTDAVTFTVMLDGFLTLSPGEHLFIRASPDGYATSQFIEVTNFAGGVGTFTLPGSAIPAGTTVNYYALVTEEAVPDAATIDYHTLFFGNNNGNNYEFTVSTVTGMEDVSNPYGIMQTAETITINNSSNLNTIELMAIDGKLISTKQLNGEISTTLNVSALPTGIYMLNLAEGESIKNMKISIN